MTFLEGGIKWRKPKTLNGYYRFCYLLLRIQKNQQPCRLNESHFLFIFLLDQFSGDARRRDERDGRDEVPIVDDGNEVSVVCRRIFEAKVSAYIVDDFSAKCVSVGDVPVLLFLRFNVFPHFFADVILCDDFVLSENSFLIFCARIRYAAISRAFCRSLSRLLYSS